MKTSSSAANAAAVDGRTPGYRHVQMVTGLWWILPTSLAGTVFGVQLASPHHLAPVVWTVLFVGVGSLVMLGRLVIEVVGSAPAAELRWHFGWLPWPRWRLPLADVVAVEPARSTWLEGWGIRSTREGKLYNASGTQAVRLRLRDGTSLRLGSTEPERLRAYLQARLQAPTPRR
jgi:hypothetical protein